MTVEGATNVTETAAEKVTDAATTVITELVDSTNLMYIAVAIVIGAVVGIAIVLMMDDATEKRNNQIADALEMTHNEIID